MVSSVRNADTTFREVVKQHVDGPLLGYGFRRSGRDWLLSGDGGLTPMVNLQELSRREDAIDFVLDWGIFSDDFCRLAFSTADVKPSILRCPFVVRLVLAPNLSDQWWEVGKERAWLVNADGTRRATDFSEVYDGLCEFVRIAAEVDSTSNLLRLMRSLVDRGDARVNFTPAGNAFQLLERLRDVR